MEEFLNSEKQSKTDSSHKCVAKKYSEWISKYRLDRDKKKKIQLTRNQHAAFRGWKYHKAPYIPPKALIVDELFARFLLHCLLELKSKKSSLRAAHGWMSFIAKGK